MELLNVGRMLSVQCTFLLDEAASLAESHFDAACPVWCLKQNAV